MKTTIRLVSIFLVFLCITLLPKIEAVDPPPDGGYPGENTAEGTDALFSVTPGQFTGINNTALGFDALFHTTTGIGNTAVGSRALFSNTTGDGNTAVGVEALKNNPSLVDDNTAVGRSAKRSEQSVKPFYEGKAE
jgi:hypothetical protein